ncbi:TauD/TfdA family dioxygenase [Streptomyces sp. MUM 203J]|uniref:TauD/TfdA family dioxygenase n=1 Tax=Streptomyces sp. MUM 203J TaxID=2791990 RepID=UPI001F04AB66|nr:TauD/TfdA family dioxygenase [Streptomyces sp. MUM 203J]MCH0539166.1 TauD/TfdA family dioxygenase [Streptomyces sp. MUM 203J]
MPAPAVLPLVVEAGSTTDLVDPIEHDRDELRSTLGTHGALLFRGFDIDGVDGSQSTVNALSGETLTCTEASSPRTSVQGSAYTSTDHPAEEEIFLHNECSYPDAWPMTLHFSCLRAPQTPGSTPLADTRRLYAAIDPGVREEFARRRWSLVRNYHPDFGVPWAKLFGTDSRAEAEACCKEHGLIPEGTGEDGLPTNAYYGDGGRIPDDVMDHLRSRYADCRVRFDWQQNDILVVDNMLSSHGREPFAGDRKIAVAMAEPHTAGQGDPR